MEQKKTIIYVGGFELPDKNAAAHRVIANGKILRELNYKVVFLGTDKTLTGKEAVLSTRKEYEGFAYYAVKYPVSLSEWLTYLSSVKDVLQLVNADTAMIIAYNYPAVALSRLSTFCKKKEIKILADCTEWYEAKGNLAFKLIKGFDVYLRMRLVHPKLNGLIVISDYLSAFYESQNSNLINLPPLVDLSMRKWDLPVNDVNDNGINLIYAGSPGANKDRVDRVVNLLAEIRTQYDIRFTFKILGLTETQYLEMFDQPAIPENIKAFLTFAGRLPHIQTLREISKSDFEIFIREANLTNNAGFPTKFVESISCGTPVLSNSSSNISDYLLEGKTGFLLDDSTDEKLKDSLYKALLTPREDIQSMKAYCRTCKMFDFNNFVKPMENFLLGL